MPLSPPPVRQAGADVGDAALSALSLTDLRRYRQSLLAEDDRVSYWRRLVHARLDLRRAGARQSSPLTVDQIAAALRATGAGGSRHAFAPIASAEPWPQMPTLERFWQVEDADAELAVALTQVEEELSAYRRAVHRALDAASAELVARYQQEPAAALMLLPEVEG